MKAARIILLLLVWHSGFSQWTDSFEDGDFIINPSWTGNTAEFIIESNALRLSAPAVSGFSYLSTPSANINDATWQFSVRLDFNPSSNNYAKAYLVASNENLNETLNGYFIKIGGTSDEVSLYRQDGITEIEIIDGTDGRLSLSLVNIQVLVSRSAAGQWQLSSKLETESNWYAEGNTDDLNYVSSLFFGFNCVYTSTRSSKFYFDDVMVTGTPYVDELPPQIDTVYAQDANHIFVHFNEHIEPGVATILSKYLLNSLVNPIGIGFSDSTVLLEFASTLSVINNLSVTSIEDLSQNVMADTTVQVIYIDPAPVYYGDIVINEIMADPTPKEDLPEVEYIELHNVSNKAINMTEWSFSDRVSIAGFESIIILPDSFLILSRKSDIGLFQANGKVLGLSPWPSLNNSGDSLSLANEQDELIDIIVYDNSWYQETGKQDGGWSLERINPKHPCSGYLNWQASVDQRGGSPGQPNSVSVSEDHEPPLLINYKVELDNLIITFNEPLKDTLGVISVFPANTVLQTDINYNQLYIGFSQPFVSEEINMITISYLADCFDNEVQNISISFTPDFDPPHIDTVFSEYPNIIDVYFNEDVQEPQINNFFIESVGQAMAVEEQDQNNGAHISLIYNDNLDYGASYTVIVDDVADFHNNMTVQSQYKFIYQPLNYPQFGEVLITEIMADPIPPVNLPEFEYIELTNKTSKRLLLKDLMLADAKNEVIIPTGIIEANERVVLTKTSAVEALSGYAKTIGVPNWPTLNNVGDQTTLFDPGHQVIHHVAYSDDWYDNNEKSGGGWSLELIDESNYCGGNKVWTASTGNLGGTPGIANSIVTDLYDLLIPHIEEAFAFSPDSILIRFNESLANQLPTISISNHSILDYYFSNLSQDEIILSVAPLQARVKYEIAVNKIIDCTGNINDEEKVTVVLPEIAEGGEVIVSEILFNPRVGGVDFIEIYNNSAKYVSLLNWQISNGVSSVNIPTRDIFKPYSYRVFTELTESIIQHYPNAILENIYSLDIPAMANTEGNVVLQNEQNFMIDSVHYEEDWHFPYLESVDGVSLERIDLAQPAYLSSNWASAASTENFATPGYKNSQSATSVSNGTVNITPKVIVPDANGRDDFTNIVINQQNSGSLVTITVYNLQGQPVRKIANNSLVGSVSNFTWDGTDNSGSVVPLGHYIVVVSTISNSGTTQTYRDKIVVGTGF